MRKITIGLPVLALMVIGIVSVSAVIMYQFDINMNMGLSVAYGFEVVDEFGVVVDSIDWGVFGEDEVKYQVSPARGLFLRNIGNVDQSVYWVSDCPSEWLFVIGIISPSHDYLSGVANAELIPVGTQLEIRLRLQESTAIASVAYGFSLSFLVDE